MFDIIINTSLSQRVDEMKTQSIKKSKQFSIGPHLSHNKVVVCKLGKKLSPEQNTDFADFSPLTHSQVKLDDVD